jgi:hypothetical protein
MEPKEEIKQLENIKKSFIEKMQVLMIKKKEILNEYRKRLENEKIVSLRAKLMSGKKDYE